MHIAIDDTYGPDRNTGSRYVTGKRRTHVAVLFPDTEVSKIRLKIKQYMNSLNEHFVNSNIAIKEFHFVDIYNRKPPWKFLPSRSNIDVFSEFSRLYKSHQWKVLIQTIDDRTLNKAELNSLRKMRIDGLDLKQRSDISLLFLLIKIKQHFNQTEDDITLLLDEGRKKAGVSFGREIFSNYPASFRGSYAKSESEPLLQIADFLAFCINRSTHLSTKPNRTELDLWFLNMAFSMEINCDDLKRAILNRNFSIDDFDEFHRLDHIAKGIE